MSEDSWNSFDPDNIIDIMPDDVQNLLTPNNNSSHESPLPQDVLIPPNEASDRLRMLNLYCTEQDGMDISHSKRSDSNLLAISSPIDVHELKTSNFIIKSKPLLKSEDFINPSFFIPISEKVLKEEKSLNNEEFCPSIDKVENYLDINHINPTKKSKINHEDSNESNSIDRILLNVLECIKLESIRSKLSCYLPDAPLAKDSDLILLSNCSKLYWKSLFETTLRNISPELLLNLVKLIGKLSPTFSEALLQYKIPQFLEAYPSTIWKLSNEIKNLLQQTFIHLQMHLKLNSNDIRNIIAQLSYSKLGVPGQLAEREIFEIFAKL